MNIIKQSFIFEIFSFFFFLSKFKNQNLNMNQIMDLYNEITRIKKKKLIHENRIILQLNVLVLQGFFFYFLMKEILNFSIFL